MIHGIHCCAAAVFVLVATGLVCYYHFVIGHSGDGHDMADNIWELLSILLISDEILHKKTESEYVNGLSICIKNNSSAIIKIWISNNSNNSIKNLSKKIIDKFGYNIIYKHNNPEY